MTTKFRTVVLRKRSNQHRFGLYISDDIPSGVYIVTIEHNSAAMEAGLQPGDRILAVNGQLISISN